MKIRHIKRNGWRLSIQLDCWTCTYGIELLLRERFNTSKSEDSERKRVCFGRFSCFLFFGARCAFNAQVPPSWRQPLKIFSPRISSHFEVILAGNFHT
jgi:hypothetical protein